MKANSIEDSKDLPFSIGFLRCIRNLTVNNGILLHLPIAQPKPLSAVLRLETD